MPLLNTYRHCPTETVIISLRLCQRLRLGLLMCYPCDLFFIIIFIFIIINPIISSKQTNLFLCNYIKKSV